MTMRVFGYVRVSTLDQFKKGFSVDVQREEIKKHFDAKFLPQEYAWAGIWEDKSSSGRKPFLQRRAGAHMDEVLRRDDVVIFYRLDRGFRSLLDMLRTLRLWRKKGVKVVIMNMDIDTSTATGQMILKIMAAVAEFETELRAERIAEGKAAAIARGLYPNGNPRYGFKLFYTNKGKPKLLPAHDVRDQGAEIVRLHDEEGMTFPEIADHFNKAGIKPISYRPQDRHKQKWWWNFVRFRYHKHKKLDAKERPYAQAQANPLGTPATPPAGEPAPGTEVLVARPAGQSGQAEDPEAGLPPMQGIQEGRQDDHGIGTAAASQGAEDEDLGEPGPIAWGFGDGQEDDA